MFMLCAILRDATSAAAMVAAATSSADAPCARGMAPPAATVVDLALVARHLALGHSDARDFPAAPNNPPLCAA
jgi:hypothetical protein